MTNSEHTPILRTLDAAANRAREGLRVVEDFARFQRNDAHVSAELKAIRHTLQACLVDWKSDDWLPTRDTAGDVGTTISTAAENQRADASAVVRANLKRLEESLRTLEEFGKILDPQVSVRIEQLRYRVYRLEQRLLDNHTLRQRLQSAQLYLLVTSSQCQQPWRDVVRSALDGGVDIVQLREKELDVQELLDRAEQVREWTREAGALFIMNDRPDLAVLSAADGVHVGQEDLPPNAVRQLLGTQRLVGVSTHQPDQLQQAESLGADYVGVGPVFASRTKDFSRFAGLDYVTQVAEVATVPWFAIGGIDASNVAQVCTAGASRIAVSSAICAAANPGAMARQLKEILANF
ncbi:MAG: thiamine phosphate synthase [Planctomycetaceae bacterium]|nr:thiamine phosphate synthase [Planctomycetaceae bacterium]